MIELRVVSLSKKYISDVARLESNLIAKTSEEKIAATLDSEILFYFVLLDGNRVCGFLECSVIAPESELFDVAIDEEFQGRGYSKILMDFYLNFAKEKGCDTIFLEVNNMNMKAIGLYQKYGFTEYGRRKNYYGSNDAILMKRKI